AEVGRFKQQLGPSGPIDICILGLGSNGHIAFNEPADALERFVHVAQLSPTSQQHGMVAGMDTAPEFGFTVGMTDIFRSKMILLLVSGASKKAVTARLLSGRVSTNLPASLLWLHGNTVCLLDQNACE
ncbi:MAG TPA: 6-phosphogluconolactonase, partial [Puia sp.]|nr:6-phosphogluconolactonase [Puia sp.]